MKIFHKKNGQSDYNAKLIFTGSKKDCLEELYRIAQYDIMDCCNPLKKGANTKILKLKTEEAKERLLEDCKNYNRNILCREYDLRNGNDDCYDEYKKGDRNFSYDCDQYWIE